MSQYRNNESFKASTCLADKRSRVNPSTTVYSHPIQSRLSKWKEFHGNHVPKYLADRLRTKPQLSNQSKAQTGTEKQPPEIHSVIAFDSEVKKKIKKEG